MCVFVCVLGARRVGGVVYTPDSDLAQSTHPFPIIQDDTVEERLREEKGSRRKRKKERMGISYEAPPSFFLFGVASFQIVFVRALFPHTNSNYIALYKKGGA